MKNKKLSIFSIVFALSILSANAEYYNFQELELSVRPYFELERASGANTNAVTSITSSTSLTITTPITLSYNIYSNDSAKIAISAIAPVSDGNGNVNALYGTAANAMKIVFTKSDSTAASSAVTNASSTDASSSSNINAIAFTFTPETVTATEGTAPTLSVKDNEIIYTIGKGSFNIPFKIDGSSLSCTFSPEDKIGEYKATLIVSKVDA